MMPNVYPYAVRQVDPNKYLRTPWPLGKPEGITIHDSGGGTLEGAIDALVEKGLRYHLIIDRDGSVVQTANFSEGVWHAGTALWNDKSPNRRHVSICVIGFGRVRREPDGTGRSDTGNLIEPSNMALRKSNVDHHDYFWHIATPEQVSSLTAACLWFMHAAGIKAADICGHDEAALPLGRKEDPGGSLPWPMPAFRDYLQHQLLA